MGLFWPTFEGVFKGVFKTFLRRGFVGFCWILIRFRLERSSPLGWKHPRVCSSSFLGFVLRRGRKPEEKEDDGGEEGSYNAIFVFSLSFLVFPSFDGCISFSIYVLVSFLRVTFQRIHICIS